MLEPLYRQAFIIAIGEAKYVKGEVGQRLWQAVEERKLVRLIVEEAKFRRL
jgi:hypothetical protein